MADKKIIESFVESQNLDYLYLLLANLEANRLNSLPATVKRRFPKKITEISLENVAKNQITDFIETEKEHIDLKQE